MLNYKIILFFFQITMYLTRLKILIFWSTDILLN